MRIKFLHNRWRFAAIILFSAALLGLNTNGLFAQEETQEPPVEVIEPTVTELPTEIPTEIPTEAPTEPPAPTEVIEPTATEPEVTATEVEATSEVTEEATQEATVPAESTEEIPATEVTALPTEEVPSLEPEPGLMLVYMDNFSAGQTIVWTLGTNWAAISSEADYALKAGDSLTELWLYENLFDAAVQARVFVPEGAARLTIRRSVTEGYTAELNQNGDVKLYRAGAEFASVNIELAETGGWHTLRLSAMGAVVRVAVDGVEAIALQDDAPLPPGKVFLSASSTNILFDDFQVWTPDNQPPPMLATPPALPPTEDATPESTPEVTAEATEPVLPAALGLPPISQLQDATTFIVNMKEDNYGSVDACDAEHCTLRDAITAANANTGFMDTIEFNIPVESSPFTIFPVSCQLPAITDPVIIDGYTQPNAVQATASVPAVLKIEIAGNVAQGAGGAACPAAPDGLRINTGGSGSIIRGLSITRFLGNGIQINDADNVTIEGNFIGLEVGGSTAPSPKIAKDGVLIVAGNNNIIGGTTPAARNVISGNTGDGIEIQGGSTIITNWVVGNYIGTDKGGSADQGNGGNGIYLNATPADIGGPGSQYRNVISGNTSDGIEIRGLGASGSVVQGNYIGLNASGSVRVPNDADGVYITGSSSNIIGGTLGVTVGGACTGACNVITGNGSDGIELAPLSGLSGLDNQIWGNFIGLNPAGTGVVSSGSGSGTITGNAQSGIRVNNVAGVIIGGFDEATIVPEQRNIISGNQGTAAATAYGIYITGSSVGTKINGNYIGTNSAGNSAIPNDVGIMIQGPSVTVGGLTTGLRNIISGNSGAGIEISGTGATDNRIRGNFIGTDATGTIAVPNTDGVRINGALNNFIGDTDSALSRNVISGNSGDGIEITGAISEGNRVQLNLIGVDASGVTALGNQGNGVRIASSAKRNQIGYDIDDDPNSDIGSNIIANNTLAGVAIETDAGTGNTVMNNSVFSNGGLGIDLGATGATSNDTDDADTGPNNLQNFPVLTTVTRNVGVDVEIQAVLDGIPDMTYRIDFFANTTCDVSGYGEGTTYLASLEQVFADANGMVLIETSIPDSLFNSAGADFFTMTATDFNDVGGFPEFNTSEFSRCIDRNNNPPTISDIVDQTTRGNNPVTINNILVNDIETPVNNLVMSAVSSDTAVIPNENITFGGSGGTRTMNFFAVNGLDTAKVVTISVRVIDGNGAFGEDTFVVNITPNVKPTITAISDKTTAFMAPITVPFTVGDTDDDPATLVMIAQSSSNLGVVPLSNIVFGGSGTSRTVTVTPAAGQTGSSDITIRVTDGDHYKDELFKLTVNVNTAPTSPTSFGTGQAAYSLVPKTINFTVNDTTPTGILTVIGESNNQSVVPNANITTALVSGTTWSVTITPLVVASTTSVNITLTMSDGFLTGTKSFPLAVSPNLPPTIGAISSPQTTLAGVPKSITFTVTDSTSTGVINLSATSDNQAVVADEDISFTVGSGSSRTITLVPVASVASAQTANITITASDGNASSQRPFALTVNVNPNTPPTISNIPNQTTSQGTPIGPINFTVSDATTPAVDLEVSGTSSNTTLVPNASITFGGSGGTRTISVQPAAGQLGETTITVIVEDGGGSVAQDTFILTVEGNTAPTISPISNRTTAIDTPVGPIPFTVGDSQTPAGNLIVTGESLNPTIVINAGIDFGGSGANRTVTVTPLTNATGTATLRITVSDGDLSAEIMFNVTVNPNNPPVISDISNKFTTISTQTGPIPVTIGDVETPVNALTVGATSSNTSLVPNNPSNIVLGGSGANRTLNLIPLNGVEGTSTITVTVTDGKGATATDTFILTVAINIPPTISEISDQTIAPNKSLGPIIFTVSDAETALSELIVDATSSNETLVPNANIFLGGSEAERTLFIFPKTGQSGQTTITVTVTDGANVTAEGVFELLVQVAPPIPNTPANRTKVSTVRPTFNWSAVTGAKSYSIQLDNVDDPQNPVNVLTQQVVNNSFTSAINLAQGSYAWQVKALNASGGDLTGWSTKPTFTVNILKSPANGSFTTVTMPTFTWNAVSGATYQLEVDDDDTFGGPLPITCAPNVTTCKPTTALAFGTYFWRVNINGVPSVMSWRVTITSPLLAAPVLSAPAANAFTKDSTPTLSWNAVTGAGGYEVHVDDQSTFTSPEYTESGITGPGATISIELPEALADKRYNWRVRTITAYGAPGAWSAVRAFTVDTQPQATPGLRTPVNNAMTNDTTPTFTWNLVSGASRYVLDVARDVDFIVPVNGLNDVSVVESAFTVPANLALPNGTYYWRVWSVDKAGNESDPTAPPFVVVVNILKSPANGAFMTDTTPTFSWSGVTAGTSYQLEITSENDTTFQTPRTITGCGSNGTTTALSCTPTNALPHGRYIWRVNVNSVDAELYRLLIVTPAAPGVPTPLLPANNAAVNDTTPTLSWAAPNGTTGAPYTYQLQVDDTSTFASPVFAPAASSSTFQTVTPALPNGKYFWRVRTLNQYGASGAWSSARTLTIDTTPPAAPVLTTPVNNAVLADSTPTLIWKSVAGAKFYLVDISANSTFTTLVIMGAPATKATYTVPNASALANGLYYWRVRTVDAAGNVSPVSAVRTFRVNMP